MLGSVTHSGQSYGIFSVFRKTESADNSFGVLPVETTKEFKENAVKYRCDLELAKKHTNFTELTPMMINEFIGKIIVHAPEKVDGDRVREMEIYLNFIGRFELPPPKLPPKEIKRQEHLKKERARSRVRYQQLKSGERTVGVPINVTCNSSNGVKRYADRGYTRKILRGNAAYCRVSTNREEQETSYEAQISYYTDKIGKNSEWQIAGTFADEGITGTKAKKRPEFLKMIRRCRQRKIDLILTKSLSRLARNTVDSLNYIRELKALGIAVYFEKENIPERQFGDIK